MYLEHIESPGDLKRLDRSQLHVVAREIRSLILQTVARTGGHLASNLGSVELTLALHYLFDSPRDKILWDVGHQAYPHKVLTGRRDRFPSLRQEGGLSGFTRRIESGLAPDLARCRICGRPRGYIRRFGLCRICFRELALQGQIPGVTKSSW